MNNEKLMSIKDVYDYLQVSRKKFWMMRECGQFPVKPVLDSPVRYRKIDIDRFLESGKGL